MYSVGPHFTGHDDEAFDEKDIAKFYDDVMGKNVARAPGPSSAPGGDQVPEHVAGAQEGPGGEREGQGVRVVRWCDVN